MAITKISPSVVDFDAGITISTADNLDTLTLTSTDADANAGPYLNLYRNSSSPADSDQAGQITFTGRNDNSQDVDYARIITQIKDASDSSEDGRLAINTMVGGSIYSRMNIVEGETVFNDESIDVDFRVESNGSANMLFVDGGNDRVGIGSAVGTSKLNIYTGNVTGAGVFVSSAINLMHTTHTNGMAQIAFGYQPGSLTNAAAYIGYVGVSQAGNGNGDLVFGTRTATTDTQPAERMRIKADGQINVAQGLMAIGTTSRTGGASGANVAIEFGGNSANGLKMRDTDTNASCSQIVFVSGSSLVGSVSTSSSATAFNQNSDYRLKENVIYDWEALSTLTQLKPAKFNFKTDTDKTVEGFLAHEVSSVVPAAITGEKDAMETRTKLVLDSKGEVLEEGVEEDVWTAGKEDETYPADSTWEASKEYPSYQQIDQSKLVPLLVKAVQELEAKVKALEEA